MQRRLEGVHAKIRAEMPQHVAGMPQRVDVALLHVLASVAKVPDPELLIGGGGQFARVLVGLDFGAEGLGGEETAVRGGGFGV